ncbi:hypothetical protein SAMN05216510_4080 [Pseudomonas coleopterorum]|nr:hypothetical protein SAMN05216510_4080 [Pseudomonas coleopterorum]
MFCTHEDDMACAPGLFVIGLAHWNSISRSLNTHWYHVSVMRWQDGSVVSTEELLSDELGLSELLSKQDAAFRVSEVQIVTPSRINGGASWCMERLQSLSMGFDCNDVATCLFQVESGAVYHDSNRPDFDAKSLTGTKQIYRASN